MDKLIKQKPPSFSTRETSQSTIDIYTPIRKFIVINNSTIKDPVDLLIMKLREHDNLLFTDQQPGLLTKQPLEDLGLLDDSDSLIKEAKITEINNYTSNNPGIAALLTKYRTAPVPKKWSWSSLFTPATELPDTPATFVSRLQETIEGIYKKLVGSFKVTKSGTRRNDIKLLMYSVQLMDISQYLEELDNTYKSIVGEYRKNVEKFRTKLQRTKTYDYEYKLLKPKALEDNVTLSELASIVSECQDMADIPLAIEWAKLLAICEMLEILEKESKNMGRDLGSTTNSPEVVEKQGAMNSKITQALATLRTTLNSMGKSGFWV
jgi:hypothetical protein